MTGLKLIVTLLLIAWVFTKIPWSSIIDLLKVAKVWWLLLAVGAFIASQWLSAKRLLRFFYAVNFTIAERENNILYLKGMFYNFFIPGGIGGDAYKVFHLNKTKNWSAKQLTKAIFNDRLSGLVAIVLWVQVLLFSFAGSLIWWVALTVSIGLTVVVSYKSLATFFPDFKDIFYVSLGLSLLVQGFQLLCVCLIVASFSTMQGVQYYLVVFLVSSVLSVLSFSGIGVREWLFYQAATYYDFNETIAVSIGLLFSFITALISLTGFFFRLEKK